MPGDARVDQEQRRRARRRPARSPSRCRPPRRRRRSRTTSRRRCRQPPSIARRGRRDARRVRAGVLLGHRVGVVQLAAQRGLQLALDLLGRAVREHVVGASGTCQESAFVERPNCSSTRNHSTWRPALAAVLARVQAAGRARARAPRAGSRATSSSGRRRRARSASTSRGISTSSTNARARACSSRSGVMRVGRRRSPWRPERPARASAAGTDPRRGREADRARGHQRRPDRADRDGGGRLAVAAALPLRLPRRPAGRGARALLRAGRRRRASAPEDEPRRRPRGWRR